MLITVGVSAVCIWELSIIVIVMGINVHKILHSLLHSLKETIGHTGGTVRNSLVDSSKLLADGVPGKIYNP
jgi:hypothetical protein